MDRWEQIKLLFHAALERPLEDREAFLKTECGPDDELLAEVESLIQSHETEDAFLNTPAAQMAAKFVPGVDEVLYPGAVFGIYRISGALGEGGMGTVYLAEDTRLGRKVALKLLPRSFVTDADRVRRFEQEARATSALNHPNILTIHEIGEEAGTHFIATEYVEGLTLREHSRRARPEPIESIEIAIQIGVALSAAHAAKIVHRDIKPENLMIRPDGYVKVLDFGLAKPGGHALFSAVGSTKNSDSVSQLLVDTQPGVVMGTVAYMSPEQARGITTDQRTDIWSLGVVLYEMVSGHAPFAGPTPSDVMAAVLQRDPVPLSQIVPDISPELERIVVKALAKEREDRYQTARDMVIDLRRLKQRMEFAADMRETSGRGAEVDAQTHGISSAPQVHAATSGEQLKHITVLFVDVSGLAALTESHDVETASEMMRDFWSYADEAVLDFGGSVQRRMGGEMMALWGVRVSQEDDPENALRAALRIREEASRFVAARIDNTASNAEAPVRAGVNTGAALLENSGSDGDLVASGATVNVAQRLKQSAPEGSILISHDTYRHVRGVFDVRELDLQNARGAAEPVRTYLVERAKPRAFHVRTRGVEGIETRMVGRQAEIARMRDALETVIEDGELQTVTVIGEAGLGKSRLLYEFSNEVELLPQRINVFQGRASQWARGLPYALVRDVFSFRFDIQDSDSPSVAREKLERGLVEVWEGVDDAQMRAHFIGHLIGFDFSASPHLAGIIDDAKQVRGRAFHYASQFFAGVARKSPTLLYLDDLHWADEGSLDFVEHLERSSNKSRVLLLCFARPDLIERRPTWGEGEAWHARLTLQPLTRRESRQLVEEILRHAQAIPHALRELVVSAAEGNPFYVEELIKVLIEQRVILPGAGLWRVDASRLAEVRVPPTLTGVLQARLDALSPWEKTVLQRASVIGREFWQSALESFSRSAIEQGETGEGDTPAALERLRRKELLYRRASSTFQGTHEYIFKHAILRSVTYENVLKRDRRKLHRQAAEWLIIQSGGRVEEYAAVIGEHFERAREPHIAADWYGRAGNQARQSYAPQAAIDFFRKALELMNEGTSDGVKTSDLRPLAIRWYGGLGEVLAMQARYDEAVEAYEQMRQLAETLGDSVAQARAWNGLTAVREYQGQNRDALDSARRAEELARAAARATAQLRDDETVDVTGGDVAAVSELAVALNRQGLASHRLGDASAVMKYGEMILELSQHMRQGRRHARANGLRLVGVAHEMSGQFAHADQYVEESLALLKALGDRRNVGFMLNNLGVIAHLRGDYEEAVRRYDESLAIFREIGEKTCELPTLGNLAGAQIGLEQYAAAEANLRDAIHMTGPAGHFALSMVYCYLAETLCRQTKVDAALETAQIALKLGYKTENQDYIASAWRTLGLIAAQKGSIVIGDELRSMRDCFAESLRIFQAMGAEAECARTLREWARCEMARGDREHGAAKWKEASEIFSRLKMDKEVARMPEINVCD